MEREEYLKEHIKTGDNPERIELHFNAYLEGLQKERELAIEAHRLCCSYLFGNRCMNHSRSKPHTQGTCEGNCLYIRRYKFELYKLET